MSAKQDRASVRTFEDLNRKYMFEKKFKDIDRSVSQAQKTADEAQKAYNNLNQEEIFNRLTNNGEWPGFFYDENGQMYINASYIKSGFMSANLIKAGALASEMYDTDADGFPTSGMIIDLDHGYIATRFFAVNSDGEVIAPRGKIGAWTLGETPITVSPTEKITEYALYSDEMYDVKNGKTYTYRVYLTPRGVYVDGRDNTGASYFANKTWLDICGG